MSQLFTRSKPRVCAVSYLNTVPLVWGMLHGPQSGQFDLVFRVPAECADMVEAGNADIGIIPSFELTRQHLATVPGVGIASRGAVRSILLVSKRSPEEIETLAADSSSRTSTALTRIVLKERYGAEPQVLHRPPDLASMLRVADAALIIGDPALRIDPETLPYRVYDLGHEWTAMTGLPMVFALWAGHERTITETVIEAFQQSWQFGRDHLEDIVRHETASRGFPPDVIREYLTLYIVHQLGPAESEGLKLFLKYAAELSPAHATGVK